MEVMCWVIWLTWLDVKNMGGDVIGRTCQSIRTYEWRPELALEGGW